MYGSRGLFVYQLVNSLKKSVSVNILSPNPESFQNLIGKGSILPNMKFNFTANLIRLLIYTLNFLFLIICYAHKSDVIHANWGYTGFLAILTKPIHRKKIILTERSPYFVTTKNKILHIFLKFTYKNVDRLVVLSNYSKDKLCKNYNLDENKILVIPNGIEYQKPKNKNVLRKNLNLSNKKFIALFIGRLEDVKGVNLLIDAAEKIQKQIFYVIIGNGSKKESYVNLVKNKNLSQKFKFLEQVPHEKIFDYMQASDVFVFPSLNETGGNVLLEAAACNLPILSTRVGWAEDVVSEGDNGFFLEKNNSDDIKIKLEKVLNKTEFRFTHVRNLPSWEDCAQKYIQEYSDLIGK